MSGEVRRFRWRVALLVVLAVAAAVCVFSLSPRADPASYFDFADQRRLFAIAHFMDVVSNAPWAVIGACGLVFAWRTRPGALGPFAEAWERAAWAVLFVGVIGVSIGSSFFHLEPAAGRLVWDRLPMTVVFMSVCALVIGDRISLRAGRLLLLPLLALGISSVLWWRHTLALGMPDLRPYALVQYVPMAAVPALLLLFPGRYTHVRELWWALGCYALAKVLELADKPVLVMTGVVSGHTLKHLAAAAATLMLLKFMQRRKVAVI